MAEIIPVIRGAVKRGVTFFDTTEVSRGLRKRGESGRHHLPEAPEGLPAHRGPKGAPRSAFKPVIDLAAPVEVSVAGVMERTRLFTATDFGAGDPLIDARIISQTITTDRFGDRRGGLGGGGGGLGSLMNTGSRRNAPAVTRTRNLLIRSQMLYPIELRVPCGFPGRCSG
ncbi:MAG: hypothetical protein JWL90_2719 [Chthoniobacteraceae bacterium]|nr:hypothetical protein [Chthoniobacteraceae bacterium]